MDKKRNLYYVERATPMMSDGYDSAVVIAEDEESARLVVPFGLGWVNKPSEVKVVLVGVASDDYEPVNGDNIVIGSWTSY